MNTIEEVAVDGLAQEQNARAPAKRKTKKPQSKSQKYAALRKLKREGKIKTGNVAYNAMMRDVAAKKKAALRRKKRQEKLAVTGETPKRTRKKPASATKPKTKASKVIKEHKAKSSRSRATRVAKTTRKTTAKKTEGGVKPLKDLTISGLRAAIKRGGKRGVSAKKELKRRGVDTKAKTGTTKPKLSKRAKALRAKGMEKYADVKKRVASGVSKLKKSRPDFDKKSTEKLKTILLGIERYKGQIARATASLKRRGQSDEDKAWDRNLIKRAKANLKRYQEKLKAAK